MREDFSALRLPDDVLAAYPPDRDGLFQLVRRQITEKELIVISECDYGNDRAEHLSELRRIRDGIDIDKPLTWAPNEVLCLFRWSENNKDLADPISFHRARAFACCSLLDIQDVNENRSLYGCESLGPLIESSLVLGSEYTGLLACKITSMLQEMEPWDGPYLFAAFGLLALIQLSDIESEPKVVAVLMSWLVSAHDEIIDWHSHGYFGPVPTFMHIHSACVNIEIWQSLVSQVKKTHGDDPLLGLFLARLLAPTSLKTKVKKASLTAKVVMWGGREMLSLLWKMRRKE